MDFATAAKTEANYTTTENGAVALRSTNDARLDLFGVIGALREADKTRVEALFAEAYNQDPLFATKIAFYARDVRGGLGERETFRVIIRYMAQNHPEALRPNLDLIGVYGRYDDLYALVGTPVEDDMWAAMKSQFESDIAAMKKKEAVSLLAKWIKTADASSKETRRLGIMTANKLGYSVYEFKRLVRALRKEIGIVEAKMSAGRWDEIKYPAVPSRAMMIYRNAFARHDEDGYSQFINDALQGKTGIHAGTLYPYDIVEKFLYKISSVNWEKRGGKWVHVRTVRNETEAAALEAQWRQLPDYVDSDTNALVIADVSGSMTGRPMATSIGLAIYFASHNKGAYHNLFMDFTDQSRFVTLKGETLLQQITNAENADWGGSTNLEAAFRRVLNTAIENHVSNEEMPKALIVISDMEIDSCGTKKWSFYDQMASMYAENGYTIPNIVFWNVDSRSDVYHADKSRKGVQLVSGQSAATFRHVLDCINLDPVEAMENIINSPRYDAVRVA